jgi:hypothetical protein
VMVEYWLCDSKSEPLDIGSKSIMGGWLTSSETSAGGRIDAGRKSQRIRRECRVANVNCSGIYT